MYPKLLTTTVALLSLFSNATVSVMAQSPAPPAQSTATAPPATPGARRGGQFGAPPVQSPEVDANKTVTFRLRAPNATEVTVRGITPQPLPMKKDASGVWSATTEPLKPDLYAYSFDVDGLRILDPSNLKFRPSHQRISQSAVLVPGDMPWTPLPNVPRGAVSRHVFQSKIANYERDFFVYTPPNYDPKRKEPYPILILQHGWGDEANAWIDVGGANVTLDTLINQGKAVPMIMVNPHGYGTAAGPADIDREDMTPTYVRVLLEEVMPQVEKLYHVSNKRTDRAIAGLSMGGAEAMLGGLNHLDKFAWLGSFSGAFNIWPLTRPPRGAARSEGSPRFTLVESQLPTQFPKLDAKSNAQIKLLWITCGTSDGGALPTNRQFKKYLDSQGIKVTYTEVPDIGHVWPFWRQNLADFASLLFR